MDVHRSIEPMCQRTWRTFARLLIGQRAGMSVRTRSAQGTAEIRSVMARLTGRTTDLFQRRIVGAQWTRSGNGTGIGTEVSDGTQLAEGRGRKDTPMAHFAGRTARRSNAAERSRWTRLRKGVSSQRVELAEISCWTGTNIVDSANDRSRRSINGPNENQESGDEFQQHLPRQIESNRIE